MSKLARDLSLNDTLSPGILTQKGYRRKRPAPMVEFNPVAETINCGENTPPEADVDEETNFGVTDEELETDVAQQETRPVSGGYRRRRPLNLLTLASNTSCASTSSLTTPDSVKRQRTPKHLGQLDCPLFCLEKLEGSPRLDGSAADGASQLQLPQRRRGRMISLQMNTPSSCGSSRMYQPSPRTPDPVRSDLKLLSGTVAAVMFDFDGTLTATPGDAHGNAGGKPGHRNQKQVELVARAQLLAPRLQALREAGIILGIISKSSEGTIYHALLSAGLADCFQGPIIGTAIGFDGKAGFIEDLVETGSLKHLSDVGDVLLVDDDVRELDRARQRGVQTFPAPAHGGLQESDFDEIFESLGLQFAIAA